MPEKLPLPVPAELVTAAESSLRRCTGTPFLQAFYDNLLAILPHEQGAKFDHTDFDRQHKLIQHALGLLFSFAKKPNPALLERIAVRHGRGDLDVPPALHAKFADAMIQSVRQFDPQCTPAVEEAWRAAIAPGVEFISSRYGSGHAPGHQTGHGSES